MASHTVHTLDSLSADQGGPSRSVSLLCAALARCGTDVQIVTSRLRPDEGPAVLPPPDLVPVHFAERPSAAAAFWGGSAFAEVTEALLERAPAVLHDHGIWLPTNHLVSRLAQRTATPRVLSTRGMLTPWALQHKQGKKKVAWALYQHRDLEAVTLFHATSEAEAEGIRNLGFRQPIAVVPNGVDVPAEARGAAHQPNGAKRRALFLSRLHSGKGLPDLFRAWAEVQPAGWELVVAGPDAEGHRAELERLIPSLGLEDDVQFLGPVEDEAKWAVYRSADFFVLPTHSENFGTVVAEALASAVPVLTTRGAPWQDLETHACGWWVDIGPDGVAAGLREAVACSDDERAAMGQRGRALVERDYSWTHVAEEMTAVYAWLLGLGSRPACVVRPT
ncbi:MAG: glycosyltransferase [Bacteroidota bacterium]